VSKNSVYCIEEIKEGSSQKNLLTEELNECFTITDIELWKVKGDLPQG
jgi:hypothetical protein